MPAVNLSTCLDAVRDILEEIVYLGTPVGVVHVRQIKLMSKATFERVFSDNNESQTLWIVSWDGSAVTWTSTPGFDIQRNYTISVDGYRPRLDTESATFDWSDVCDHVHRQISRSSMVQLGLEHSLVAGIRVGPWSCENRGFETVGGVEMFRVRMTAEVENAVEQVD